jgi:CheY-like chemotaxis protein
MSTILVVDDDQDIREVVQNVLESEGFSTIGAHDGKNAMAILNKLATLPSLILFDLMMPIMNGWDLAAALSNDDRWASMPRLAMSAQTGDLDLGSTRILRKPFLTEQLISAVRAACPPSRGGQTEARRH